MRRHNILTGILLMLATIDFALAAPVLVQEKHEAHADVVHVPKDVITVVEKRWDEELERFGEAFFRGSGKPVSSKPPALNPASSTTDPESSCWGSCLATTVDWVKFLFSPNRGPDGFGGPMMSGYGYGTYEPYYHRLPMTHAPQQEHPWIHPLADPNFNWEEWIYADDPPLSSTPPRPSTPEVPPTIKEEGQASGYAPSPPLKDVVRLPPSSADSKPYLDDQSSAEERQAAMAYAAKGKMKESRHISDTARDAGNAT